MKRIAFLFVFVVFNTCAYAQLDSVSYKRAMLKTVTGNRYATLFCGYTWPDASIDVEAFCIDRLGIVSNGNSLNKTQTVSTFVYCEKMAIGRKPRKLTVKYTFGKKLITKNCTITGDESLIFKFFILFWNTRIRESSKPNEIAKYTFGTDNVALIYNPEGYLSKIAITKNPDVNL
jgi:hypothetical protein